MKNEKVEGCDTGDEILRSRGSKKFCGDTGEDTPTMVCNVSIL
jgi:hypothetical protein